MKYIDADKLIAEIERWRDKAKEKYNESTYSMGRCDALSEFRNHIVSLQQEQPVLPGIEDPGIPGKDFIPVEWVDACEMYGKWKIVKVEQQEVDLKKEINEYMSCEDNNPVDWDWRDKQACARNFYELGFNARKWDNHWKPSEEQMKALLGAEGISRASGHPDNAKVLASLYEQLKRLHG